MIQATARSGVDRPGGWRQPLEQAAERLRYPGGVWLIVRAIADAQVRESYSSTYSGVVHVGAWGLAKVTSRRPDLTPTPGRVLYVKRTLKRLEADQVLLCVESSEGGRISDPDRESPGRAKGFQLGYGCRPRVLNNGSQPATVQPTHNGSYVATVPDPNNGSQVAAPTSVGSKAPSVVRTGRGVQRRNPLPLGTTRPDVPPRPNDFTQLGSLLPAGPPPVPEDVTIASLLATPLSRPEISLELPPRKRRRR